MGATVSRYLLGLSVSLAIFGPAAHAASEAPSAPAAIAITFAEQPARLVRGTGMHRAGRGVVLQDNDMLESNAGALQVDAGGSTLAIGPATRVFIRKGGEIVLLDGWLKLRGSAVRPLTVATSSLQLASGGATVTLHALGDTTELFAESGEVPLRELGAGKPRRAVKVASEQFATRSGALPLRIMPRPPAAFLAALPRDLRDALVPLGVRGPAALPKLERAASFAELAPWLAAHPTLRRQVQLRFDAPRTARAAPSLPPDRQ
jgi:hypothetical protein